MSKSKMSVHSSLKRTTIISLIWVYGFLLLSAVATILWAELSTNYARPILFGFLALAFYLFWNLERNYTTARWASVRLLSRLKVLPWFKDFLFNSDWVQERAAIWASYSRWGTPRLPFEAFLVRELLKLQYHQKENIDQSDILAMIHHLTKTPIERLFLLHALEDEVVDVRGVFLGVSTSFRDVDEVLAPRSSGETETQGQDIEGQGSC